MSFNSDGLRKIYSRLGIAGENPVVAHNGFEREAFEESATSLRSGRASICLLREK